MQIATDSEYFYVFNCSSIVYERVHLVNRFIIFSIFFDCLRCSFRSILQTLSISD